MSGHIETLLRDQLAARASVVSARDEWQAELVAELNSGGTGPGRRYAALAMAAVLVLIVGTWWLGRADDRDISPVPPVPDVSTNAELIDHLPVGEPAQVIYYDTEGRVMTPDGEFPGSDTVTFRLGRNTQLVGRSGDGLLVQDEQSGYVIVGRDGSQRSVNGPNPGLYAVSPDGRRSYVNGDITPIGSSLVIDSLAVPTHINGSYSAYWSGAGIVFTDETTGTLQLVPTDGGAAQPVTGDAPVDATVHPTRGSDRVLVRNPDGCAFIGRLDPAGHIGQTSETCQTDLLALSPDGTTALRGQPRTSMAPPGIGSVTALMDVDTGRSTQLPWLAALDQYPADDSFGDDLFAMTWENGNTVLLAYYTDRSATDQMAATVRLVRCSTDSETCQAVPGEVRPRLVDGQMFSQGVGEAGVY